MDQYGKKKRGISEQLVVNVFRSLRVVQIYFFLQY
jgi:hypothetical protein